VTWAEHVAPLVFAHCADCHHADGIAPFSLLTYRDARKRARQMAVVTEDRYMPPWPPEPASHSFVGERGLSDAEIAILQRWHEAGAPEGEASLTPPTPEIGTGWQLGEPDLVLPMPEAFTVPAEGLDVFRNFVIPVPTGERRFVRAVELRPGNARVVHHAILHVDPERLCRRLDAADGVPGFEGMELGDSRPPDGHFVGWTPGRVPVEMPADMAWPLEPASDLVLQLHLVPTGKPEPVRSEVGLYFADEPPARRPYVLLLRNDEIDIAPGDADFRVDDEFELPVPVKVLAFYPHAHYLGKDLATIAVHPDGREETLLRIPDWDFNWQDEYRLVEGIDLAAGTTLAMRHVYDNSEENLRNPFHPPRRARFGQLSTDEMATLTIQVLPSSPADRDRLEESWLRRGIARYPDPWAANHHLATLLRRAGRLDEAVAHFRETVRINPRHARGWHDLGAALAEGGDVTGALAALERASSLDPGLAISHQARAVLLQSAGRVAEAVAAYRAAIAADGSLAPAHRNLGRALASLGLLGEGLPYLAKAVELEPGSAEAHHEFGGALAASGRFDDALRHEELAIALRPDWSEPLAGAARILAFHRDATKRDPARAVELGARAVELAGDTQPLVLDAYAAALVSAGRAAEAVPIAERALASAQAQGNAVLVKHLSGRLQGARVAAAGR
jgi:tetratricopeptide (TPR) repeat protein